MKIKNVSKSDIVFQDLNIPSTGLGQRRLVPGAEVFIHNSEAEKSEQFKRLIASGDLIVVPADFEPTAEYEIASEEYESDPVIIKGEKGDPGERGPAGPRGERGEPGRVGPKGDQGERGYRGERGMPGAVGPAGPKGDRGDMGDRGPRGDKGESGQKGDRGDQGPTGEPGPMGADGKDGRDGKNCECKNDPPYRFEVRGDFFCAIDNQSNPENVYHLHRIKPQTRWNWFKSFLS